MKLSAIIITRNEEEMIAECIKSLSFADEVLVVDSTSSDATVSIARKQGARVVSHTFKNYADQRNVGLEKSTGDWIVYVDADERVSEKLRKEIREITNYPAKPDHALHDELRITNYSAYTIPRKNYYLGNNPWPHTEYLERLFLKKALKNGKGTFTNMQYMTVMQVHCPVI